MGLYTKGLIFRYYWFVGSCVGLYLGQGWGVGGILTNLDPIMDKPSYPTPTPRPP